MQRKNVVIFTYYWPPSSAGGVWRFLKVSKYLYEFGWNPIIVTVKNGAYSAVDHTLVNEVPDYIEVHKTKTIEPFTIYNLLKGKKGKSIPEAFAAGKESRGLYDKISLFIRSNFFIPDPRIGWKKYAVAKFNDIAKKKSIDAIITTGPPHSVHLIGRSIKRKHGTPWLVDFRDPWVNNYLVKDFINRFKIVDKYDAKLERKVLEACDRFTCISPGMLDEFSEIQDKGHVIYNGFDEEDFSNTAIKNIKSRKFTLSYIGSLKPNMNISALWRAIKRLIDTNNQFSDEFILQFTGKQDPSVLSTIVKYIPEKNLRIEGFVDHETALEKMSTSTALLFIVPQASYSKSITSGKVFEYLAAKTPILPVGPLGGDADYVLQKSKRNGIIDYEDEQGIYDKLLSLYQQWTQNDGQLSKSETEDYLYFSRKNSAKIFADVLNSMI